MSRSSRSSSFVVRSCDPLSPNLNHWQVRDLSPWFVGESRTLCRARRHYQTLQLSPGFVFKSHQSHFARSGIHGSRVARSVSRSGHGLDKKGSNVFVHGPFILYLTLLLLHCSQQSGSTSRLYFRTTFLRIYGFKPRRCLFCCEIIYVWCFELKTKNAQFRYICHVCGGRIDWRCYLFLSDSKRKVSPQCV